MSYIELSYDGTILKMISTSASRPPSRNIDFIGRNKPLDPINGDLPKILNGKSHHEFTLAVAGSGGVGKSQLVREYSRRFKDRNQNTTGVSP